MNCTSVLSNVSRPYVAAIITSSIISAVAIGILCAPLVIPALVFKAIAITAGLGLLLTITLVILTLLDARKKIAKDEQITIEARADSIRYYRRNEFVNGFIMWNLQHPDNKVPQKAKELLQEIIDASDSKGARSYLLTCTDPEWTQIKTSLTEICMNPNFSVEQLDTMKLPDSFKKLLNDTNN